ncbi:MAG: DUF547 domain-containing protein [Myxococcota bacterium]
MRTFLRRLMLWGSGALLLSVGAAKALGLQRVRPNARPATDPQRALDALLERIVVADSVNYDAFELADIEAIAAAYASTGPNSEPDAYTSDDARLAYYLNAYNTLVLFAVKKFGVQASVHEVRGLIEPKAGFGFFWGAFHRLDGSYINLYDLEHTIIRGFGDARIHAAINCASRSCPSLRGRAFTAENLNHELDEASAHFVSGERHVRRSGQGWELSAIFDWYRNDFGGDAGIRAFIRTHCQRENCADLDEDPLSFRPYDWSLNAPPTDP